MRVLLIHELYGSSAPSGENQVFIAERNLLIDRGIAVGTYNIHNDVLRNAGVLGLIRGGVSAPWNPFSALRIRRAAALFQADIIHVHNSFPLISPSVFWGVRPQVARVFTLHNYRIYCPGGLPFRNIQVCTQCLERRSVWPAIRFGCYRGSRVATLSPAFSTALNRAIGTWSRKVDAFIALSAFQRDLMVSAGLPAEKVFIKPNFFPTSPEVVPQSGRGAYVLYVGRLSTEKGLQVLIDAWRGTPQLGGFELRVVGSGPLEAELAASVAHAGLGDVVKILGQLPSAEVYKQISEAKCLVIPSICFEGFPMVVREAFAYGTPVIASDIGPLPSIVVDGSNGRVFTSGSSSGLAAAVLAVMTDKELWLRLSGGARRAFELNYAADTNFQALLQIYSAAREFADARVRMVGKRW